MKTSVILLATCVALGVTGCSSTYDKGPYVPEASKTPPLENTERIVLMDPGVQYSLTCTGIQVAAQIRNRENRRIEVQVNCVFKDANGYSTNDETPFQTLILTENATEQVKFTAMNTLAKKYTIRVRQAR
jgi:uncharacterized protein YcfL